jgi:hypothetical protein
MSCGALNGACCAGEVCQPGGACVAGADAGMSCTACGGSGQPCCPPASGTGDDTCNTGFACINPAGAAPAACQPCGARGQPCCGSGTVATGTCSSGLSCANVQNMGIICVQP